MNCPIKVLVVDDSKVSRIMSTGLLRKRLAGVEILEAGTAADALVLIHNAAPDWLLLDHNMPGMSGLELAESLVVSHPSLRIALLTANIQDATQHRAAAIGVHFFRKPISESVIAAVVDTLSKAQEQTTP